MTKVQFQNELVELFHKVESFNEIFQTEGQHPMLKQFMSKKTSIETICVLDD